MASVYAYDNSVATTSQEGLKATASALRASLDDLGGFVSGVCANWEGDERDTYRGIQQKWDSAALEIKSILDGIEKTLGDTTQNVTQMRSSVKSALQG